MNWEETQGLRERLVTVMLCTSIHQEVASVLYVLYCRHDNTIRVIYF